MYTTINFKTKKALKEAIAAGRKVSVFQPGGIFPTKIPEGGGTVYLEGPHYPQPHSWYASAIVDKDGYIVKVKNPKSKRRKNSNPTTLTSITKSKYFPILAIGGILIAAYFLTRPKA